MPSICFLITSLDPIGGAEMQVANLAKALQGRGWTVLLISMLPEGTELATELRTRGVSVATLCMQKGKADPRAIWRLAKILKRFKPEVLHAHMVHANLLARVTRLFAEVPLLVSTAHSIREGGRLYDLAYRITDMLGDVTTNVSLAAARRYARDGLVPEKRLRVVRNGIDVNRFRPSETSRGEMRRAFAISNQFVWLAIGGLRAAKDYPNMLRAVAGLRGALLLIAGEGELRVQLERLALELKIRSSVRFCGFCPNTAELLNAADGYVLSSLWEGLPLVLLEAAATALPIVATDVGGNAEIVLNGKSGILVPAADSVALQRAMQTVMAISKPERCQMGMAGREFVSAHYSMSQIVSDWENLYREFLTLRGISRLHVSAEDSATNSVSVN
jgi:glycosyltransferase involved in cell wall biosynthesis